ncbi:MAG: hypothetical protein WAX07_02415 [Candidatus Altiarchaeia archaeon]
MAAITLSVPEDLKKRMESVDWINWSSVARKAFIEKLSDVKELETKKKVAEISEIADDDKRVVREDVAKQVVKSIEKTAKAVREGKRKPMSLEQFNKWCDGL